MASNKLFNVAGTKERLFEMMQKVNKVSLNEDFMNNPEMQNSTDSNILEDAFNKLKTNQFKIKQSNTQTSGGETYLELIGSASDGVDIVFRFKIETSEGDQDGVISVNDAELSSLISTDINIPEGAIALQNFNAQHKDEIIDVVSEYADFTGEEPELDEEYMEAAKKIDSYPFGGTPRKMVTPAQYLDQKPTNPALRVKSPELNKFVVGESAEHERYSSYSQDINNRLKKYADAHGENWIEIKNEFMREADPYNMKSPKDQQDAYFALVDEFLTSNENGVNEGNVVMDNPETANLGQKYYDSASNPEKVEAIEKAIAVLNKLLAEHGASPSSVNPVKYKQKVKEFAILIYTTKLGSMNEVKKKKKESDEYPDQIGSHFKPKNDYPVVKKKPTKVVQIDEEDNMEEIPRVTMPNDGAARGMENPNLDKFFDKKQQHQPMREEDEPNGEEEAKINKIEHDKEEHGEKLVGGKGDEATPQEFDQEQVLLGLKVEMEHTDDPTVALEIVLDHLTEDPEYYTTKEDPEASAQFGAAKDAAEFKAEEPEHGLDPNMSGMMDNNHSDDDVEDVLLGYKPHNVGDDLDEESGYEEYQGNVGDRYSDKDDNEFTVSNKTKGGVGLRGQGGSKEVATSDVMKMRKLGGAVEEAYGQPDPLKIPMLPKDNKISEVKHDVFGNRLAPKKPAPTDSFWAWASKPDIGDGTLRKVKTVQPTKELALKWFEDNGYYVDNDKIYKG